MIRTVLRGWTQIVCWWLFIFVFAVLGRGQQIPEVTHNGVRMYSPDKPFEHVTLEECDGPGCASATPGGSNQQFQFNNSGAFAGAPLTWDGTNFGFATGYQIFGNHAREPGTLYDYNYTNTSATLLGGTYEQMAEVEYRPNIAADTTNKIMQGLTVNVQPSTTFPQGKYTAGSFGTDTFGTGTFQSLRGLDISASNFGATHGDELYGVDIGTENFASGSTVDNAYGIMIQGNTSPGTITNNYGIFIKPQVGGLTNYDLYADGASQQSAFAGTLKVGFGSALSNVCTQATGCGLAAATVTDITASVALNTTETNSSGSAVTISGYATLAGGSGDSTVGCDVDSNVGVFSSAITATVSGEHAGFFCRVPNGSTYKITGTNLITGLGKVYQTTN